MSVCAGLNQAVSATTAASTSQTEAGHQTPDARTPEQVVQGLQTHEVALVQPVALVVPIARVAPAPTVVPALLDDEQRQLERFGRLQPPTFSGVGGEDAQVFLDKFQPMLYTAGIMKSSGVAFTTFQFTWPAFT